MKFRELDNPFTVQTPEGMSAEDTVSLFVDVFSDFRKIPRPGHVFIHGPRGSGKSMMFRYLQPDCQCIANKCKLSDLPFYGIYIPLKYTDINLTELRRLENQHANTVLNEHFMVMYFACKTFSYLYEQLKYQKLTAHKSTANFIKQSIEARLNSCGWKASIKLTKRNSALSCLKLVAALFDKLYSDLITYFRRLSFYPDAIPFNGPLCGYSDFLLPLLNDLKLLPYMPKGPIYLLIDDADNLTLTQTKILNSWVSARTSSIVSIKVSTQMRYKTFICINGQTIDTPHDYSDINISTIYTTAKAKYKERVHAIVSKRLTLKQIPTTPEEFFPHDEQQEKRIKDIADAFRKNWSISGRGHRPSDDALRYARPDFMKSLSGSSKSSSTYSYAGFDQLVHVSSGIVRYFLEPAALMYSDTISNRGVTPSFIPPSIQNEVIRKLSDDFLFSEFDKIQDDKSDDVPDKKQLCRLRNLITALGGIFRHILLSDRSERRVFSIAFSDNISDDIRDVLKLGIRYGYFHESTIGNKEGTGRTRLYILSRRLAPYFNLDPTGFAGYLFVTSNRIIEAMQEPKKLLQRIEKKGIHNYFEERQLILPFDQ